MSHAQYVARLTLCECGHQAAPWHYDSWRMCLHDDYDCDEFKAVGPEIYQSIDELPVEPLASRRADP